MVRSLLLLALVLLISFSASQYEVDREDALPNARWFNVPMAELLNANVYLATTAHDELVVRYAPSGCDLVRDDYITHADSIRLLTGGLDSFLKSGEKEVVAPVVDDSDAMHGGHRLLGFVRIEAVTPRRLGARRGDISFDLEEGGPAPSIQIGNVVIGAGGAKTTSDKDYTPPPKGGGACITGRDCFDFNGTCVAGLCKCAGEWTGTYCQLHRPQTTGIAGLLKKKVPVHVSGNNAATGASSASAVGAGVGRGSAGGGIDVVVQASGGTVAAKTEPLVRAAAAETAASPTPPTVAAASDGTSSPMEPSQPEPDASGMPGAGEDGKPRRKLKPGAKRKPKPGPGEPPQHQQHQKQQQQQQQQQQQPPRPFEFEDPLVRFKRDREKREREAQLIREAEVEEAQRKEAKVREIQERARLEAERRQQELDRQAREQEESGELRRRVDGELGGDVSGGGAGGGSFATIEDLYGYGKAYPEPYNAGKVPRDLQIFQQKARLEKRGFVYSVRFRSGPLGMSFDNRPPSQTQVERVAADMQADHSGVKSGDVVIAIDQFNVSGASAKISQRILASLGWPRILTFEAPGLGEDPEEARRKQQLRQLSVSVVYPPPLVGALDVRLAQWAPLLRLDHEPSCPVYFMQAARDVFGCESDVESLATLSEAAEEIQRAGGFPSPELQARFPMLSMLVQEAARRQMPLELRPLLLAKRGICTFVDKANAATQSEAALAVVVNTDDTLLDMPAGKEVTSGVHIPVGLARSNETALVQLTATPGSEVLAVVADPVDGVTPQCQRVTALVEEIVDAWPHSVPSMSLRDIQQSLQSQAQRAPQLRGLTEEGGRVAVGGSNGWAFFDYHLAMFGPQELPLGPRKLQFAMPPFGCDPQAYSVRIAGTIVAVLRGGGCSFGIKVINAQKLGALAVVIVNTDDSKSMRLMALPDETPHIQIPCIMVSRRFQYMLQDGIDRHYLIDQHTISLQPNDRLGNYESRSNWTPPRRED